MPRSAQKRNGNSGGTAHFASCFAGRFFVIPMYNPFTNRIKRKDFSNRMRKELAKTYAPAEIEDRLYRFWETSGFFTPEVDKSKKPFSVVIPPPNVTGQLHMGHALNNTLQDIIVRTKRMQGYSTLWIPGTDHAGIATQIKVEEMLRKEKGLTRHDVGREKFLEMVWDWKHK